MSPSWFTAIPWVPAVPIEILRKERNRLPTFSGIYVFTSYPGTLVKNFGVLYVGKASNLSTRVASYLADPENLPINSPRSATPRLNSSLNHIGKVKILMEVQQKYRDPNSSESFIWVRWIRMHQPGALEADLIKYLQPKHNERLRK